MTGIQVGRQQIGYELTLNEELKIEPYFLTVYDLSVLFSRFVSAARDEPPDIDVDFEHERREEVLQYLYEKYGRERAGMTAEASATTAARRCGM